MAIVIDESGLRDVEALAVTDPAVQFGALGFFTTMRAERGRVHLFEWHMERLERGLEFGQLRLSGGREAVREGVERAMAEVGDELLRVKVVAGPGPEHWEGRGDGAARVIVLAMPLDAHYRTRVAERPAMRLEVFRNYAMPSTGGFVGHKSTHCWPYREARRRSKARGFDEALMLNERGEVVEASGSNVWWARGGNLFTPAAETGRLPGIFARYLMERVLPELGVAVEEVCAGPEELERAEYMFLTNAPGEVMQVSAVGGEAKQLMREDELGRRLLERVEETREERAEN